MAAKDLTATDKAKQKLLFAIRKGDPEKVQQALEKSGGRCGPNDAADSANNRLIHRAARYGHAGVVAKLVELGADPNADNKFGMVPLHHAAVGGDADVIVTLIKAGAEVDRQDSGGRLPLHWATGHGHTDAVRAILDEGKAVKINIKDKEGWTPLHRCCQQPPPPEKPKNEDDPPPPPIDMGAEDTRRSEIAAMLMQHSTPADTSVFEVNSRNTPLHLCAMNGYSKVARELIEKGGAAVDPVNKISKTPLLYACMEDHLNMVRVLLEFGADPLAKDSLHNEWNALHFAIMQDNVDVVRALLNEAKVNKDKLPSVVDAVGRKPLVVAEDHFKAKVAEYLKSLE